MVKKSGGNWRLGGVQWTSEDAFWEDEDEVESAVSGKTESCLRGRGVQEGPGLMAEPWAKL